MELLQAASLLAQLGRQSGRAPVGEGAAPEEEAFQYRAVSHLRFPPSEVDGVDWPIRGAPVLYSAAYGLLGHHGPLPDWMTEEMAQRLRRGDRAAQAFLGLFERRLFALLVRAHSRLRPGFAGLPAAAGPAGRIAFALLGLGQPGLRDRQALPDAALLPHAGLAVGRSRAAAALEAMLRRQLGVPVALRPFQGRWLRIGPEDRSRIGPGGRNNRLGQGMLVGARVWDVSSRFVLRIGPLTLAQHQALLPGGQAHRVVATLVRFFKTEALDFGIELLLRPEAVPVLRASADAARGSRLGWTSFLAGRQGGPALVSLAAQESA
jgi:type VI secretion system protein ImpH